MNSKNKRASIVLIVIGLLVCTCVALFISSKEDKKEEAELTAKAKKYLDKNFEGKTLEIYAIFEDKSSVFGYFDKAALVRDKQSGLEFMVYKNEKTGKMEDSITTKK